MRLRHDQSRYDKDDGDLVENHDGTIDNRRSNHRVRLLGEQIKTKGSRLICTAMCIPFGVRGW
jgi:hypothetical protein